MLPTQRYGHITRKAVGKLPFKPPSIVQDALAFDDHSVVRDRLYDVGPPRRVRWTR